MERSPGTINALDKEGLRPLYYAVKTHAACSGTRHASLAISSLLNHGADASICDGEGKPVLHFLAYGSLASKYSDTFLLESLVTHGADVNHADKDGTMAIHIIARNIRQVSAAKLLLGLGADIYAADCKGDTVFHEVARGILVPRQTVDGKVEQVPVADKIRAQGKMMSVLQEAASGDEMMVKQNAEGKTPPLVRSETRSQWQGLGSKLQRGRGAARRGRV